MANVRWVNLYPRGEGRAEDQFWNRPMDDVDSANICVHDTCSHNRLFLITMPTPYQCLLLGFTTLIKTLSPTVMIERKVKKM